MNLLLDTTIQIDRITGSKERKKAVEEVLRGNQLYCTTYVLGEYYNNIVNDLVTLYGLFLIDKNLDETGKRISEHVFGRSQSRVAKLYFNILELSGHDVGEVEDIFLLYFDLIQEDFYDGIENIFDLTGCARAQRRVEYEDGIPVLRDVHCTKEKVICSICPFWKKMEKEAGRLLQNDKVDIKIRDILNRAQNIEKEYRGQNCKTLGDTIIALEALECGQEYGICSSNKNDFRPLCDTFGITLVVPDYSRGRTAAKNT